MTVHRDALRALLGRKGQLVTLDDEMFGIGRRDMFFHSVRAYIGQGSFQYQGLSQHGHGLRFGEPVFTGGHFCHQLHQARHVQRRRPGSLISSC